MSNELLPQSPSSSGLPKDDPIYEDSNFKSSSVLPWYHQQIFDEHSNYQASRDNDGEAKIKVAIGKHFNRLKRLPKRDKMKYLVTDNLQTSEMKRFRDHGYWHSYSLEVDRESRRLLEEVSVQIQKEVVGQTVRIKSQHNDITEQKFNIQDAKRQNKILVKKVNVIKDALETAKEKTQEARDMVKMWKIKANEERRRTRQEIYNSCVAELRLNRDRASTLARPTGEAVCIECCCCGKTCKDEKNCCYKCYFRSEVYVDDLRFKTHKTIGCWKCKHEIEFEKPFYMKYTNDAYEMFRARTGFQEYAVLK